MEPSTTFRMLAATALVSALAVLVASPAQAMYVNDGGAAAATATIVGNPGDGAQVGSPVEAPLVTSGGLTLDTQTLVAIGGGALLVLLAAGALLFTSRHRRVALP